LSPDIVGCWLGHCAQAALARLPEPSAAHSTRELDLEDSSAVTRFLASSVPEFVFLAAAKVGGILANRDFPAEFIARNLRFNPT